MTTTRSYRMAMPIAEAMIEMRRCAGGQFDPRVVDALLQRVLPPGHRGYAFVAPHDVAA
jgi:HD-GYP domain-containing protein (c-di-GMP phosphodiesterase class II)